jgi:serine protease Do
MNDTHDTSATPKPRPTVDQRPPNRLPLLLLLLLGVIVLWYLPILLERIEYSRTLGEVKALKEALPGLDLKALSKSFALVYRKIKPSVVHIDTRREAESRDRLGLGAMFGGNGRTVEEGEASGVIVDPAGYLVTSYHAVEDASEINVKLDDGRSFAAGIVGVDPAVDLAVLKINATGLTAAAWGDSDKLEVGEMVWAIGSPYGLDQTITSGIISAKGRRDLGSSIFQEFLQTDVALNPGNSGGPLVDVNGDVVGINSAIFGRAYQGISFAIPSNLARKTYEQLRKDHKVVRGYFGAYVERLTPDIARQVGLPGDVAVGAVVDSARPGSPASQAGIRRGDVIVKWNGQAVTSDVELQLMIAQTAIDSKVPVTFYRDGKERTVEVSVIERIVGGSQQGTPRFERQ